MLSGTRTRSAVSGLATFNDLSINLAGTGYVLRATTTTQAGVAAASSSAFVVLGAATKLAFSTQPGGNPTEGVALAVQPVVVVQDSAGTTVSSSSATIAVSIKSGTGAQGAALAGTASLAAVSGQATFTNLAISAAGSGYVLVAAASGLASAESQAFSVAAAGVVAAKLAFITSPSAGTGGGAGAGAALTTNTAFAVQPVVAVQDSAGLLVSKASATIALAIKSGTGAPNAVLAGTTSVVTCHAEETQMT